MKALCTAAGSGLHGLLAWEPGAALPLLDSAASYLGLPLLTVDSSPASSTFSTSLASSALPTSPAFTINLAPSPATLGLAISDLLQGLHLDSVLLLSSSPGDFLLLRDLVNSLGFFSSGTRYQEVSMGEGLVSQLAAAARAGHTSFLLLSCTAASGLALLEAALLAGLLRPGHRLLLPCPGLAPAALAKFLHLGAAITLLGLPDISPEVAYEEALLVDALTALEEGLGAVEPWPAAPRTDLQCWGTMAWPAGPGVAARARRAAFLGLSGPVTLDAAGRRSAVGLVVVEVGEGRQVTRGVWSPARGLVLDTRPHQDAAEVAPLQGQEVLVVAATLSEPYTMLKLDADTARRRGNDRYEGFAVDLTTEIARIIGANFSLSVVAGYGSRAEDGTWTGMVGEILEGRAELAVADLTINSDREKVVDFSMPFLELGISILFVAAPSKSIDLFSFMNPFSPAVWLLMLAGGFAVSVGLFLIARVSPFETAELDSSEGESPFLSLRHCLWFSVASWMQQGCDFLPRAVSTRTLASFWWFFTLIIISSYTANLAAFLTIERLELPIASVDDLVSSKIQYGALATGSTLSFFKDSENLLYRKVWKAMQGFEDVLVQSNTAGVEKVVAEGGKFAFFMESTSLEYQTERNCRLTRVGGLLDSKSYGVALAPGSALRAPVSSAIIRLKEEGVIAALKAKWWREERGGGACLTEEAAAGGVSELGLDNVGGIFLVLGLGILASGLLALAEMYWVHCKRNNRMI